MRSLNIVVFAGVCLTAAVWLLVISGGIYGLGWWYFRPLFEIRTQVDFDFGNRIIYPPPNYWTPEIKLPQLPLDNHDYAVSLELKVPRSPSNLQLNNFMVTLELSKNGTSVQSLKRMNMVPYKSSLVETMDSVVFSPLYLFGWSSQVELLKVHLEDLAMPLCNFDAMQLSLSHDVQLAGAELVWTTQLKGLRRLMYNSPLSTCFVCVGTLWFSGVLVTITVALLVNLRAGDVQGKQERDERQGTPTLTARANSHLVNSHSRPNSRPKSRPKLRPKSRQRRPAPAPRFLTPRRFKPVDSSTEWNEWNSDTFEEDTVDTTHESESRKG